MTRLDTFEVVYARPMFGCAKLYILCSLLTLSVATRTFAAQELQASSNCGGLTVRLKVEIDRMTKLKERAKKEENAPPGDLLNAWQRTFGKKGDGVPALKELQKVRQRSDGLNDSLRAQGCATIDIDQALQRKSGLKRD